MVVWFQLFNKKVSFHSSSPPLVPLNYDSPQVIHFIGKIFHQVRL